MLRHQRLCCSDDQIVSPSKSFRSEENELTFSFALLTASSTEPTEDLFLLVVDLLATSLSAFWVVVERVPLFPAMSLPFRSSRHPLRKRKK